MFEHLFIDRTADSSPLSPIRRRKGVIIGAGQVGMACAYSLLIQDCFDELVLQDINRDRAEGEVMDLAVSPGQNRRRDQMVVSKTFTIRSR